MSRPNRVRMLLVLAFALTLAAGVVAGIGFARATPPVVNTDVNNHVGPGPGARPPGPGDWMADQLKLDAHQREQMSAIWHDAPHEKVRDLDAKRRALSKERDEAIAALYTPQQKADRDKISRAFEAKLVEARRERDEGFAALYTPEQKAKRDELTKEFGAKVTELGKEKDKLLQPLVERTRAVLTEEQRKKFDEMIARGNGPDHGGRRGGPPGGRPGSGPSTQPGGGRPPGGRFGPGDWPSPPPDDGFRGNRPPPPPP